MKTFSIDIHPELKDVTFTVSNGRLFSECLLKGQFQNFKIEVSEKDINRVKKFVVRRGDDKASNRGNWYAHCNTFAMDLCVTNSGACVSINTYRPYGRSSR